jgi:Zn-dependent metalloprotease
VFQRDSIDGAGMTLEGMVHFGRNYDCETGLAAPGVV